MRATPIVAPLAMAHPSASPNVTSGCSGFFGGVVPVAARQPVSKTLWVATVAAAADSKPKIFHNLDPAKVSSSTRPFGVNADIFAPRDDSRCPAPLRDGRFQPLRVPGANQPVRRRVGDVRDIDPHRGFHVRS